MKNRRTLAEARDELIKAQDETCPIDDAELQIVRELAESRRRAVGVPAGGLDYESIPEAVWLQAIGKGWGGEATLKGDSVVRVDFEAGSAIAGNGHGFKHIREVLDAAVPEDESSPGQAPLPPQQQPKNLGGRPGKYNWDQFWIGVVEIADKDGLPKRPELMRQLYEKMSAEWGWVDLPAESAVRRKLSLLYTSLKLPEE